MERYRDVMEARDEAVMPLADGMRYYDLRISPLSGRGGRVTGRLIALRGITERKPAKVELRRAKNAAALVLWRRHATAGAALARATAALLGSRPSRPGLEPAPSERAG